MGDTVTMSFLSDTSISTIFQFGSPTVSTSPLTVHNSSCNSSQPFLLADACRFGSLFLNVSVAHKAGSPSPLLFNSDSSSSFAAFASDQTVCFLATDNQVGRW